MSTESPTNPGVPVSPAKVGFLQRLRAIYENETLQHVAVIGGIVLGASVLVSVITLKVEAQIEAMSVLHDPTLESFDCIEMCKALPDASVAACTRLGTQAQEITGRINFYYDAMKYYTSLQFAFVISGYTMGIMSALLGVAVSRSGWGDCDKRLLTAFGTAAAITAFFEGLPALVKFQTNINQNSDTFLYYDDLFDEVETFCTMGVAKDGSTDSAEFVLYVDRRIAELNEMYFEVDESQMGSGGQKFIQSQDMEQYKPQKPETAPESESPATE